MSEFKELTLKARVIKTKEELDNMMKKDKLRNYTEDDFLIISKYVDKNTYQPCMVVALKEPGIPLTQWMMFAVPLELTVKEESK